ncbi:MAG: adenylate/guanylate cyclase domain-containing protein [Rhizobiaceae bacterium]
MQTSKRRLAAIVAADVAGYSRMMSADEEGTIAELRSHRAEVFNPALARLGGRIANTAGDSLLIEFPSAVDALKYSIDVQRDLAERNRSKQPEERFEFRIGINVGDVVAEGDDLLGDGVNVAARIEGLAPPGGICLSRSARDQVRDRLDVDLEDLGEIEVKNIRRPVRVFRVVDKDAAAKDQAPGKKKGKPRWIAVSAAMVLLAFIGAGAWWWSFQQSSLSDDRSENVLASNAKPTIAVLPFTNLSGENSESYFSSGITEDIATDLSQVSGLLVTSSSTAKKLNNNDNDLVSAAAKFDIGHLITGSVRRSAGNIRITAKLIDVKTGTQMWAERFDRKSEDIFAIQDEITGRVVEQLSAMFGTVEFARKKRAYTPNPEAYDYYLRGRAQRIPPTPENLKSAFANFNKAIEVDPKFAGGYAGAAFATILAAADSTSGQSSVKERLLSALGLAKKAVELDPEFGPGWSSLAEVHLRMGQHEQGLEAIKKAIQYAPSDALMRANYGRFLGYIGRAPEGIEQVVIAMRMNPDGLPLLFFLGSNQRAAGKYQEATSSLIDHRKRLGGRILPAPTLQLAAAYAQSGKLESARQTIAALLKVVPGFTISKAMKVHPYKSEEDQRIFKQALRDAGLPE